MVVLKRFVLWENVARAKGDGPDGGAGNTPPEGTPTQKRNVQKSPQKLKQEELQKQRQEKAQDVGGDDFSTVIGGDGYSTVIGDGDAGDRGSTIQRGSTVLNDEPEKEAKSSIFNALERTKLGDGGFGGTNLLDYDKDFAAGCRDRVIKAHELYELSLSILMNHGMASESEIKDFALESDVYRLCEYASAFKSENREKLCKSFNELLGINIKPDEIKGASAIVLNAIELRDQTLSKFLENLKKHMGEADYPFADFKYRETNVVSGVDFAKVGQLIVKVENAPRPGFVKAEEGGGRAHKGQQAAWGQLKSGTETLSNPGDKKLLELTLKIENLAIEKVNATNGAIPGVKLQDENDKDQASELLKRINESKGVERLHALVDFANSAIPHTIETSSLKQSKQEEEKKKEEFVADPDVVKFCDYMGGNKTTIEQKVQLCEAIKAVLGIDVAPEQLNTDGTKDALTKAIQLKNYGVGGFLNDVKGSPSITNQNFIENFERSMMPETIANIFATLKPESPSKQKAAAEQSALSILSEAVDYFNVISSKEVAVSVEKKKGITPQSSPLSEKRRTHSSGDLLPKPNKLTPEINPDAGKDKTGRFMFGKKRGKSYSLSTTQKNQLNRPGRTGDMVGDRTPTMKVLGNLPAWEEKTKAALKKHDQNIEELGVILRNAGFSSTERKQVLDVYRHDDFATQCAALVTKLKIFKSNDQIKVIAERIKKIIESKEPNLLSNKEKIDAISSAYEELKGQFARETEVVRGYAENLITMSVKLKSALEEEKAAGENKDTAVKQGDKKLIELAG